MLLNGVRTHSRLHLFPHLPLLRPVERFGNRTNVGFFDWIAALGGSGQEGDFFLNVGGEIVEQRLEKWRQRENCNKTL